MTETITAPITRDAEIGQGLRQLVQISGQNSKDHGFHEDFPTVRGWEHLHPSEQDALRRGIAEKLALVHEEISEMLGEIRSGHDPLEIYYVRKDDKAVFREQAYDEDGKPLLKPEGFLVEAADAIIRLADLAFLLNGGDVLADAQRIKHEYNATRPFKHGRKF